ncbi:efflux transporter outer membrane subunit [Psychrobacter sp. I-STPA10]|uniref:efflux transporter outer membrane subunit n=1 Tax=Psychrobacter sp. I-STPA10 TaxID=2585769 RepID=UPI001E4AD24B|nr:efflux transporter outer membrane subunit [Psychrobacter sp. I-STPA10]
MTIVHLYSRHRYTCAKWLRLSGITALVASMAACNSIPAAQNTPIVARPNISTSDSYPLLASQNNTQPSSQAALRWQDFYTDDKLKALIAIGLENNKDISQAALAIRKAQAQYGISETDDRISVNANGGYTRSANHALDKNPSGGYNVNLGMASYELDFWGKIANMKEQALQNFLATTAAKDTAQVSLISNIAASYVNLSYQLKQFELAEQTYLTRLESLRITKARLAAGIDSKAPSLQSEIAAETARIAILEAQSNIEKAKNALQYLVGVPIPTQLMPAPAVPSIATDKINNPGLPSELLRYRPDILQAEYNLKAAGANIEVARTAYYPSISLTGQLGYSSSDLSNLLKNTSTSWSFGPSISIPIFDAGKLDANYAMAQIEREQALNNYEKAIQTAFKEVNDVLADKATLAARLDAQYRLQQSYDELYNISEARYKAQVDDYLSVLDAQRSLFSTQQSILNLEREKLTSQIDLYKVLGGGANLIEPVAILTPQHRNLVNILTPESNETIAENAIKAASSAPMITAEEAQAIELESPVTITQPKTLAKVDLNRDSKVDAAIVQLTQVNIPQAKMLLENKEATKETMTKETMETETPVLIEEPVVIEETSETEQNNIPDDVAVFDKQKMLSLLEEHPMPTEEVVEEAVEAVIVTVPTDK